MIDTRNFLPCLCASRNVSLIIELPAKVTITSPSWIFCAALPAITLSATVIFSRIKLSMNSYRLVLAVASGTDGSILAIASLRARIALPWLMERGRQVERYVI